MENFNSTIQMISRPRKSHHQISKLYEKLGRIDFFRHFSNNNQKAVVYELLSKIHIEYCEANTIVFRRGDLATKFYIIVEGEVAVFLDEEKGNSKGCPYPEFETKYRDDPSFFDKTNGRFLMNRVAVLKDGQGFGELGVMNNKPRLATVLAVKRCAFGILLTEDFRSTLQPTIMTETDQKVRFFKQLLEQSCHFDEVWRLSAFFNRIKFEPYQIVMHENEEFEKLFVIVEGLIQLEKDIVISDENDFALEKMQQSAKKGSLSERETTRRCYPGLGESIQFSSRKTFANPMGELSTNQSDVKTSVMKMDLFKKTQKKTIYGQPIVVYGQNHFLGFKEFLESSATNFFRAKVIEPGYGYWIHVGNMQRCFSDFRNFELFFMQRHAPLLRTLNVDLKGIGYPRYKY